MVCFTQPKQKMKNGNFNLIQENENNSVVLIRNDITIYMANNKVNKTG